MVPDKQHSGTICVRREALAVRGEAVEDDIGDSNTRKIGESM